MSTAWQVLVLLAAAAVFVGIVGTLLSFPVDTTRVWQMVVLGVVAVALVMGSVWVATGAAPSPAAPVTITGGTTP